MQNRTSYHLELLDLLENQGEIIADQNNMIIKLVNENLEKENMIEVLSQELKLNDKYLIDKRGRILPPLFI